MSGRAVARGAIVSITAALVFAAMPVQANEAAHKIAEKFAGEATAADPKKKTPDRKAGEAKKPEAEPTEAAAKLEAERKAEQARKQEAQRKAEAARKAAEAKRRAAAKAAEDARRAAELRRADEQDMLARARREAEEMRAAAAAAQLTEEARRLIEQAEKERAKAEELLAGNAEAPKRALEPVPVVAEPERAKATAEEQLAQQRTEESRRLAEKLNRVRQIRESRLAKQTRREAAEQSATAAPAPVTASLPAQAPPAPTENVPQAAATPSSASAPAVAPAPDEAVSLVPAQVAAPVAASATSPPPQPDAKPPTSEVVATAPASNPPLATQAPTEAAPPEVAAERTPPERAPHVATAPIPSTAPAPAGLAIKSAAGFAASRVTVLLVMTPGTYGIRRNGPKVADPVLCTHEGCYVSAGADRPAAFLPARRALGFRNTWGARAGACRNVLGCVFRGIDLGNLPGYLQPVDLHIFKHDRRVGHAILSDSDCRTEAGRLSCRHGIDADDYTMWIVPETLAATAGPAALQRALTDGLNAPRSAQLAPRR